MDTSSTAGKYAICNGLENLLSWSKAGSPERYQASELRTVDVDA